MSRAKRSKETEKKRQTATPRCPKCGHRHAIKSGLVQGDQRWKCKSCSYQYTRIVPRGRPLWQKSLAVFLYSYNVSMHTIAKILRIQPSTVLKWVRSYARDHIPSQEKGAIHIMELDEMRRRLKQAAEQDTGILCIAIDNAAFKEDLGITITQH